MKKLKRALPIILVVVIFLTGVAVLVYPLISSVINNVNTRNEAAEYFEKANKTNDDEIDRLFQEAYNYNQALLNTVILTDPFDPESYEKIEVKYRETFNTNEAGLIGYIDIPKINVYLPIFHGTSLDVLSKGAGHLENTAFPVGGKNTHSVISAHTAYPTETFFDYLTDLKEGDMFFVHVLNQTLQYKVDQIKVVLPDNTKDLHVEKGRDLLTLLTCTPYSINTHRLLVRGERVQPYIPGKEEGMKSLKTDSQYIYFMGYKISYFTMALAIGIFIFFVVGVVALIQLIRRRSEKHNLQKKGAPANEKQEE